jgi:phage replication-related protein YjqB (UPF0714/DUF867 family)
LDRFADFAALAAVYQEDRDYRIRRRGGGTGVAVIAPHGGRIEPGSMELAIAIAGADHGFFAFEALIPDAFENMHITSHHFDAPDCVGLVAGCRRVVAIHGMADQNDRILVGGRDFALRDKLVDVLRAGNLDAELCESGPYAALDRRNICNRGLTGRGVQLELGRQLRDRVRASDERMAEVAAIMRSGIAAIPDGAD